MVSYFVIPAFYNFLVLIMCVCIHTTFQSNVLYKLFEYLYLIVQSMDLQSKAI